MKTTIFIILAVVVVVGVILGVYFLIPGIKLDGEKEEEIVPKTDAEFIAQALAEKYNKKNNEVTVRIDKQIDNYVLGGVTFGAGGQGEGGLLLAAKVNDKWEIAFDGNGSIACSQVDPYNFPVEMVNECVDEQGNLIIKDKVLAVLDNVQRAAELEFSPSAENTLAWRVREENKTLTKTFQAQTLTLKDITGEAYAQIEKFFTDYGMTIDDNNVAAGTITALTGFQKDNLICTLSYAMSEEDALNKIDKRQAEIRCALLDHEIKIETLKTTNGKEFSISLESNPTTGYSWQADFDADYIELIKQEYLAAATETEVVGSGGEDKFTFKALKVGETEITFSYLRSWESVQPIEKTIYQITIK